MYPSNIRYLLMNEGKSASSPDHSIGTTLSEIVQIPRLRPAKAADMHSTFAMRNRSEIVRWTESGREVTMEEHRNWFESRLALGDNRLFLIDVNGTHVGSVDLARRGDEVVISIYLLSGVRGRGHGRRLIREACDIAWRSWGPLVVTARILSDNVASLHAFGAAGFAKVGDDGSVIVTQRAPETRREAGQPE